MTIPPYPRATARIQLSPSFGFADARAVVPYLADLGISHLYASPILTARAGSTHGYDIVDHTRINAEYGGEAQFDRLVEELHGHGMGLILDFVPNHMGIGFGDNEWWQNVLEWGRNSPYAEFFDIDWSPSEQTLRNKVLVPILGDQYGVVLERGDLRLSHRQGRLTIDYFEHSFPLGAPSYASVLAEVDRGGTLADLVNAFRRIGRGSRRPDRQAMLIREAEQLRAELARRVAADDGVASALATVLERYNGTPGDARSFDRLHRLIERQAYRLSYWRLAANEINYRRFFDINTLAAVRMERADVFDITHQLVLQLIAHGKVQGLRLDHVDGLLDPKGYLERLQRAAAYRVMSAGSEPSHGYGVALDQSFYIVVEKILAQHERLREAWPVSGTTGYEFMALVAGVLTDPAGEEPLTALYGEIAGRAWDIEATVLAARYRTMDETLASELNVLANRITRMAKRQRRTRDFSRLALRRALTDIVARFPVYRTFVDSDGVSDEDRRDIDWAVATARNASGTVDTSAYDFIHSVLTTDVLREYPGAFRRAEVVDLAMRVQQFTAPVMAKSVEDTVFYRDARFIARNEVGDDPARFALSVRAFHHANRQRLQRHPFSLLSTATHDHKRGEDVRARLSVISEIPDTWREWVLRTEELAGGYTTDGDDGPMPTAVDRYLLYQTIVGTWPAELGGPHYTGIDVYRERIREYMLKAVKEAKTHTSWTAPDTEYEDALGAFVDLVLTPERSAVVVRTFEAMARRLMVPGAVNGLAQQTLALTVPGVPDLYQGTEFWDLTLVDPDNRRPVDFAARRAVLAAVEPSSEGCARALADWQSGTPKLLVIAAVLRYRALHPGLFAAGEYEPLEAGGDHAERVIAFARDDGTDRIVVIVPRLATPLLGDADTPVPTGWDDTVVVGPGDEPIDTRYVNLFDGREVAVGRGGIAVASALETFPVAVLVRSEQPVTRPG